MKTRANKPRSPGLSCRLGEAAIDAIFAAAQSQEDCVAELHKAVVPDWDRVAKLRGHVACSEPTWHYICKAAMAFDKLHHAGCMPGGMWLNFGFRCDEALQGDKVVLPPIEYRRGAK